MRGPLFYSKILLFGEYGIIKDSKGLSIPYNFYNGALKIDAHKTIATRKSNGALKRFTEYLENLQTEQPALITFDLEKLKKDVYIPCHFQIIGTPGVLLNCLKS